MSRLDRRLDGLEAAARRAPWGEARFVAAGLGIPLSVLRANVARHEALYARLTAEGRTPREVAAGMAAELGVPAETFIAALAQLRARLHADRRER